MLGWCHLCHLATIGSILDLDSHMNTVLSACHHNTVYRDASYNQLFDSLLGEFDAFQQCAILLAKDQNILAPLNALPLARIQFDLPAQEFKNGLALQYKKPLTWLLQYCNSCDRYSSIEHALSCRTSCLSL